MHLPDTQIKKVTAPPPREDRSENGNGSDERLKEENRELLTHPYKSSHGLYTDLPQLMMGLCPI